MNSVGHSDGRYGYRRFDTPDGTTNELVTTFLTFGQGLHNNHHRFPRDAYLAHAWYEIDINGLIILGMGKLGLVQDIFTGGARQGRLRLAPGRAHLMGVGASTKRAKSSLRDFFTSIGISISPAGAAPSHLNAQPVGWIELAKPIVVWVSLGLNQFYTLKCIVLRESCSRMFDGN